ncbi:MAG: hypothetical protein ACW980_24010 [Promethearchaeota archaeon]|jgi:hypothetical protein
MKNKNSCIVELYGPKNMHVCMETLDRAERFYYGALASDVSPRFEFYSQHFGKVIYIKVRDYYNGSVCWHKYFTVKKGAIIKLGFGLDDKIEVDDFFYSFEE